jgi:DNA repair exonuclease SbcCD ATPase subunit
MRLLRIVPLWLALAAALAAILWLHHARRQQTERLERLEAENRRLAARALEDARPVGTLPPTVPPSAPVPARVPPLRLPSPPGAYTENQVTVSLRESLARASASLAELHNRIERLQSEIDQGAAERQRLAASEADLKERLDSASRVLEAVQAELKAKNDRMAQLEVTANRLHQENRAVSDRLSRLSPLTGELEEINRRREAYLNSILRRYRDLTDQYRALAGRLDSPREGAVPSQAELSRIQNAVTGAEEDLRQLAALNAQATRLQQKIGAK